MGKSNKLFFKLPSVPKKQSRTEPRPNTATNTMAVITSALFNPEQKMFYLFQQLAESIYTYYSILLCGKDKTLMNYYSAETQAFVDYA